MGLQSETTDKSVAGNSSEVRELSAIEEIGTDFNFKHEIVWKNVTAYIVFHLIGFYGLFLVFTFQAHPLTGIYSFFLYVFAGLGVTMGAHRLFSHHSFKTNITLRHILMLLFIMNGQNSLWEWVRDHRQHHKYSDTDADPHNASRGFFFSHVGWLLSKKHPKVLQYGKDIDMSDLETDSWVMFQKNFFLHIYVLVSFLIPCAIPVFLWNEDPVKSVLISYFARTIVGLNFTWCVNSVAHIYGTRPYDRNILPTQNAFVNVVAIGEGWHNYHHTFPWDYRTSEFGATYNITANVIEYCAKKGWIYDLRASPEEFIKNRITRTGDDSHDKYGDSAKYAGAETWMNIWKSPKNPTYSSKSKPKPIKITREYALYHTDVKSE